MFGSGRFASSMSKGRLGRTSIVRPSTGKQSPFGELRAGDFFTLDGRLFLKVNLEDGVEVTNGDAPMIGTNKFSEGCLVQVENVEIKIL